MYEYFFNLIFNQFFTCIIILFCQYCFMTLFSIHLHRKELYRITWRDVQWHWYFFFWYLFPPDDISIKFIPKWCFVLYWSITYYTWYLMNLCNGDKWNIWVVTDYLNNDVHKRIMFRIWMSYLLTLLQRGLSPELSSDKWYGIWERTFYHLTYKIIRVNKLLYKRNVFITYWLFLFHLEISNNIYVVWRDLFLHKLF